MYSLKTKEIIQEKDKSINKEHYNKEVIGMAIVYKSLERIISQQEWYIANKAYRPQLVTYTFSKFVYEAKKQDLGVDYKAIWDKQKISNEMANELAKIAKLSFDIIYGDREIANISTYCKSKTCWEKLQAKPYELSKEVLPFLISNENRKIDMTRAKKDQRFDSSLDYAIKIFNLGEAYWQNLIDKATEQRALCYRDIEFLEAAKKSCVKCSVVSNKQAEVIRKIVEHLKEVGIE